MIYHGFYAKKDLDLMKDLKIPKQIKVKVCFTVENNLCCTKLLFQFLKIKKHTKILRKAALWQTTSKNFKLFLLFQIIRKMHHNGVFNVLLSITCIKI